MVIGRAGVVNGPHKVIDAALGSEHLQCLRLDGGHILLEFGASHIAVAPIQIGLLRARVDEYVHVNLLSLTTFGSL